MVSNFGIVVQSGSTRHPRLPTTHEVGEALDVASTDAAVILAIKVMKQNDAAMSYLAMAFKTSRLMRMIRGAKSTAYPFGQAHLVLKALEKYYCPRDMTSRVELNIRKTKVSMKPKEHPKILFEQMSELEEEFGVEFQLEDQIPILISASPAVYHSTIVQEQRAKAGAVGGVTIDDLEDCMTDLYRTTYGTLNSALDHKDTEMGMAGVTGIICHHCKKPGHKKEDCYSLKNQQKRDGKGGGNNGAGGKFKGKCNQCGKMGHKEEQCWDKETNVSKRPAWWKKKGEIGSAAVDADEQHGIEYLLCGVEVDSADDSESEAGSCPGLYHRSTASDSGSEDEKSVLEDKLVYFMDGDMSESSEDEMPALMKRRAYVHFYDSDDDSSLEEEFDEIGDDSSCEWSVIDEIPKQEFGLAANKMSFPDSQKLLESPNFWIADTAASVHVTPHKTGMSNVRSATHRIAMGNKTQSTTSQAGDIVGMLCNRYGDDLNRAKLDQVAIIDKGFNLFSCTKLMRAGWLLGGDKDSIWLSLGKKRIVFDVPISTQKGVVFAAFLRREIVAAGVAEGEIPKLLKKTYKQAHDALGHIGKVDTRKIVGYLKKWDLTGEAGKCESCEVAKAKQKAVPQVKEGR